MKKTIVSIFLLQWICLATLAQTVVVGNTDPIPKDPSSTLEVQKLLKSKINIRSGNYSDTGWIQFSNRNSSEEGTDFNIVALRELGLFFNTRSDISSNRNDSLFTILRNGRIGIGTTSPTEKLDVVGAIRLRDGNEAVGKILESNATGVGSWQPKTFGFAAKGTAPALSNRQVIPTAVNTQLTVINQEEYDGKSMYNAATGVITILESGVYHLDASITYSQASNGIYSLTLVDAFGNILRLATQRVINVSFIDNLQLNISTDLNCTAGQTLRLFTEQNSGNSQLVFGAFYSWLNMHKLF